MPNPSHSHGDVGVAATANCPKVFIVVLNWNRAEMTIRCLRSLEALTYPNQCVLIVDNGSTDGSPDVIQSHYPEMHLIQTGRNLGYAGGNNKGIKHALANQAEYVWILNNDCLADPSSLGDLVSLMQADPKRAVICSRLVGAETGELADNSWLVVDGKQVPVRCDGCEKGFHKVDIVSGASLFLRAEALASQGLFDETYFHYYEEVDLAERLRRTGWLIGLGCRARVSHVGGATLPPSPQSHYYFIRNRLLYRQRQLREHPVRIFLSRTELGRAVQIRRAFKERNARISLAGVLAVLDAVRGRHGERALGGYFTN